MMFYNFVGDVFQNVKDAGSSWILVIIYEIICCHNSENHILVSAAARTSYLVSAGNHHSVQVAFHGTQVCHHKWNKFYSILWMLVVILVPCFWFFTLKLIIASTSIWPATNLSGFLLIKKDQTDVTLSETYKLIIWY